MVNIVKELSVEHVLIFAIIAFLLYHLIGGCSCGMRSRDGFSVGGSESELCYDKDKTECLAMDLCKYVGTECLDTCVNKDICHNGNCNVKAGGGKECKCFDDYYGNNCKKYTPFKFKNRVELKNAVDEWLADSEKAENIYGPINSWNTSSVTDMSNLFGNALTFNGNINGWDTSNVKDMAGMFYNASAFNVDLSGWDTRSVTDMFSMFWYASTFNGDISGWDTSKVTNMGGMFWGALAFNRELSGWDTSHVTNMSDMFRDTSAFNCHKNIKKDARIYNQCIIDKKKINSSML